MLQHYPHLFYDYALLSPCPSVDFFLPHLPLFVHSLSRLWGNRTAENLTDLFLCFLYVKECIDM